jgi:lipopolysaccharide transport system ATP-binding protein
MRDAVNIVRGRQVVLGDLVEEFWALKDVSFEVKRGEVLGIIGRNGAGKGTLLKILSRITEPTQGRVLLRDRVASLLEVGTGFHPELTGRENIYLNGAILGMTRAEIRRKFEEIVAFAEVEKFLDTPVKRMYVRLAFAVAAHLDPEILIVDEVLVVGDGEFQKRCLGKMEEVASGGRTILFVSHNLGAIKTLTGKCMLLDRGSMVTLENTDTVIAAYLSKALDGKSELRQSNNLDLFRQRRINDSPARVVAIGDGNRDPDSCTLPEVPLGAKFTIEIFLAVYRSMYAADIRVVLKNSRGEPVTCLVYSDCGSGVSLKPGNYVVNLVADDLSLAPGLYFVDIGLDPVIGGGACDAICDFPLVQYRMKVKSPNGSTDLGVLFFANTSNGIFRNRVSGI